MKRKLVILLLECLIVLSLAFSGCDFFVHKHAYGTTWKSNATGHWHECACGEKVSVGEHAVNTWIVDVEATTESVGRRHGTCDICGYEAVEELPVIGGHAHRFEDVWKNDENAHWKQCACGEKKDLAAHTVENWTVDQPATEEKVGSRHGNCAVCGYAVTAQIPVIGHTHSFAWRSDETTHWEECSCGEKQSFGTHSVSQWTEDVKPTEDHGGSKHGLCDVCGCNVTQELPPVAHVHDYSQLKCDEQKHWYLCACGETSSAQEHIVLTWTEITPATEDHPGSKQGSCSICGYECTKTIPQLVHTHAASGDWQTDANTHWKLCSCGEKVNSGAHIASDWIVDQAATTERDGSKHKECTVCKKVLETATIDKIVEAVDRTAKFFAINDFHGAVDKMSTVSGYLTQQRANNTNTVIINSGDMFQGSMESNSNFGRLLTQCMDVVGFDAFVFGNHEFDWGLQNLQNLAAASSVPFLGANIYHWNASSKTWGTFASELAQKYVIKTLENGLKVGIIGVIGKDQITSISSNLVQTIGFKDPADVIPQLYAELKGMDCDLVVISAHTGPETFLDDNSFDITQYADAVFCAHTHKAEIYEKNGVPFIQGGSSGSYVSYVEMKVAADGTVSCTAKENTRYSYNWPNQYLVSEYIDNSNDQIKNEANAVLATITGGYLGKSAGVARLVCHAMATYAASQGYEIDLAMCNTGRASLSQGNVTYSNLYEAIPFDNEIFIAKVSGKDIINELNYGNYMWRVSTTPIENSANTYYTIAVLDYLLYHQNANRDYNYFKSAFNSGFTPVSLTNSNCDGVYNYRLMTRDFLLEQGTINASTYTGTNDHTDTSKISESVSFASAATWGEGTLCAIFIPEALLPQPFKFEYCC